MTEEPPSLVLSQWGVTLRRMRASDIENVREGRNRDFVRRRHRHQALISQEQQKAWFKKVNNKQNYFLVIQVGGRDLGVVFIKD